MVIETAGDIPADAEMPRVCIVVQNLPVPFDRRVWLEATTLARAGYQVSVISPKAKGWNESFEIIEGIHVHRYKLPIDAQGSVGFVAEFLWCFLATAAKLVKVSRKRGFDMLHVCNPPETFFPLGWLVKAMGKKFMFDHHDLSPEMYRAKEGENASKLVHKALLFMEKQTFKAAQVVITTNNSHKRIAVERGEKAPDDVLIVRSGPDLTRLELMPAEPEWREGKDHMVAYLGEICKQDGVDHLVRAMRIIRDEFERTDVHCVFVGGGPHQPAIKEYAAEIGADDLCTFTGRVSDEDLCRVLSSADVGVDPDPKNEWSDQSTMNKIMEYMYFSLPVVAYDLTENRFSAQEAAVYATANDERELAKTILEIIDDPERAEKMGDFGRTRIVNELSWEHSAPVLLEAYERLANK
jgi:glycosyltransferase involved in cell wall biosynthesis